MRFRRGGSSTDNLIAHFQEREPVKDVENPSIFGEDLTDAAV